MAPLCGGLLGACRGLSLEAGEEQRLQTTETQERATDTLSVPLPQGPRARARCMVTSEAGGVPQCQGGEGVDSVLETIQSFHSRHQDVGGRRPSCGDRLCRPFPWTAPCWPHPQHDPMGGAWGPEDTQSTLLLPAGHGDTGVIACRLPHGAGSPVSSALWRGREAREQAGRWAAELALCSGPERPWALGEQQGGVLGTRPSPSLEAC